LSYDSEGLLLGNFIGDAVKGNDFLNYPPAVQRGILLHRHIDQFTDHHPEVTKHLELIRKYFGKYAAVVSDIYFDHFLAFYWEEFSPTPLDAYAESIYATIQSNDALLPVKVKEYLPYMIRGNWLYGYASMEGLQRVFNGMSRRANFPSNMEQAVEILQLHYPEIEAIFRRYFPLLETEVKGWISQAPEGNSIPKFS
jgi:acyl carrier protein phosphodiesterase